MLVEVVKKENGESELGKRGVGMYLHAMKGKCHAQCSACQMKNLLWG